MEIVGVKATQSHDLDNIIGGGSSLLDILEKYTIIYKLDF